MCGKALFLIKLKAEKGAKIRQKNQHSSIFLNKVAG